MEFGLPDTTLATVRRILAACPQVDTAILYGSRAKGNYKPGSDIDLTLTGDGLGYAELSRLADDMQVATKAAAPAKSATAAAAKKSVK